VNFIERYLNSWPDHGDGSFEVFLLIVVVAIFTVLGLAFFRRLHD